MCIKTSCLMEICLAIGMVACGGSPPANPEAGTFRWATYHHPTAGYTLEHPDVYVVQEHGGGVLLRYDDYPCVSISLTDEQRADDRGLWAGHDPTGEIRLGDRDGRRFVYHHYDGPFSMRTVSYVVEHRDEYLALEFRTERDDPDEIQHRILDSFRFDDS